MTEAAERPVTMTEELAATVLADLLFNVCRGVVEMQVHSPVGRLGEARCLIRGLAERGLVISHLSAPAATPGQDAGVTITQGLARALLRAEPGVEEYADYPPNAYWLGQAEIVQAELARKGWAITSSPAPSRADQPDAAHPPAPTDSLEQAIAECEAEFDDWEVGHLQRRWDFVSPHDASVYIEVELPCSAKVVSVGHGVWGNGATPAEALRNAMTRSREREDIKQHRQVSRTFTLSDPGYAAHVEAVEKELAARRAERQAELDARGDDDYDDEE